MFCCKKKLVVSIKLHLRTIFLLLAYSPTFIQGMEKYDNSKNDTPLPIVFLAESEGNYPDSFKLLQSEIVKKYPNAPCTSLVLGDGTAETALQNLDKMVNLIEEAWNKQVSAKTTIPVIAIGSSQSALTLRLWIQKNLHKHVLNYKNRLIPAVFHAILICGMQAGYYGIPEDKKNHNHLEESCTSLQNQSIKQIVSSLSPWQVITLLGSSMSSFLSQGLVSAATPILYKTEIQEKSSFAGYWKDPKNLKDYKEKCAILPRYNNEVDHSNAKKFKQNITSVELWNFFGCSKDPKILPPQSALFRFYKKSSPDKIEKTFEKTEQYKKNLLGFKNLYDQKRAFFTEVDSEEHGHQSVEMVNAVIHAIDEGQKRWALFQNSKL